MPSFPSPGTAPSVLVRPTSPAVAVAAALLGVAIGAGVRLLLGDLVGAHGVFLVFVPAVVAGAALGGWGPGLVATALGLAAGLLLAPWSRALAIDRDEFDT